MKGIAVKTLPPSTSVPAKAHTKNGKHSGGPGGQIGHYSFVGVLSKRETTLPGNEKVRWAQMEKKLICLCPLLCLTGAVPAAEQSLLALPRSAPEAQGVSSAAIFDFIQAADRQVTEMNSFMFVRHGSVVGTGRRHRHHQRHTRHAGRDESDLGQAAPRHADLGAAGQR